MNSVPSSRTDFSRERSRRPRIGVAVIAAIASVFAALVPAAASGSETSDPATIILQDSMQRTVSDGWGVDPSGTAYEMASTTRAGVEPGSGTLLPPAPGRTAVVSWNGAQATDVDLVTTVAVGATAEESGSAYVGAHVRHDGDRSYAVRLRTLDGQRFEVSLAHVERFTATVLEQRTVDLGDADEVGVNFEIEATGTDPVVLRARAWPEGAERPDWQLEHTDGSADRLTEGGGLAWSHYASSGGSVVPVQVQAITASTVEAPDPGNDPGTDPGTDEGTDPGTGLGTDPGTDPVGEECVPGAIVCDAFDRATEDGWGSADNGGEWAPSRGAILDVVDGMGRITSPTSGRTATVSLDDVRARDVTGAYTLGMPELPSSGSGTYVTNALRVTPAGAYGVRVRVQPNGVTDLAIVRLEKLTTARVLAEYRWDQRMTPSTDVRVAVEMTGTDEVRLAAKMWLADEAEPASWQVATADSSATRIAEPGGVAFAAYSSTGGSARTASIDDVRVTPAGEETPGEPSTDPGTDPGADLRGEPGARNPADLDYPVPAGAMFVSPSGIDTASGSRSEPLRTVTAAVRTVPNGGTIVLREGSYHEEVLVPPQKRVTIQPASGEEVWFDGAARVSGWRSDGGVWVKDGWDVQLDSSPTYSKGKPDNTQPGWQFVPPTHPMAAHPDQVWIDGHQQREVARRDQVVPGTFFVDDANRQLVVGSNPVNAQVEASRLTQALSIRSTGSEVRGIGVRRYATSVPQMGTVIVAANDVTLSDVVIRDNSTTGVYSWALRTTLTRVSLIGNGLLGGGAATADGLKVDRMLSQGNNTEGFNRAPVSGAFKVTRSRDVEITDSAFVDNTGQGPWFDESVYDIVFTGNDVIGNTGNGIVLELSERAVLADNLVADNALSGIYVINTGDVAIWNNTVIGHQRNINITQDSRRASDTSAAGHDPRRPLPDPTVSWIIADTVVANNVVGGASGNCVVCVEDRSKEFTGAQMVSSMDGNLYARASATQPTWFGVWSRGSAGNPLVTASLSAFTAATGQERGSVLVDGAPIVTDSLHLQPEYESRQGTIAIEVPRAISEVSHLAAGARVLGAQSR